MGGLFSFKWEYFPFVFRVHGAIYFMRYSLYNYFTLLIVMM